MAARDHVCAIARDQPSNVRFQESIYEDFSKVVTEQAKSYRVGSGLDDSTTMGPCINDSQVQWAQQHVDDAVEKGATVLCGGSRPEGLDGGFFFSPTLLGDATPQMRVYQEETFAPVIPLFKCVSLRAHACD